VDSSSFGLLATVERNTAERTISSARVTLSFSACQQASTRSA
jgi:hypothetical protein